MKGLLRWTYTNSEYVLFHLQRTDRQKCRHLQEGTSVVLETGACGSLGIRFCLKIQPSCVTTLLLKDEMWENLWKFGKQRKCLIKKIGQGWLMHDCLCLSLWRLGTHLNCVIIHIKQKVEDWMSTCQTHAEPIWSMLAMETRNVQLRDKKANKDWQRLNLMKSRNSLDECLILCFK